MGELCALKWTDIEFKEHTISITKTYYTPKNVITKYELLTPKTTASKRTIEVDSLVIKELEKHQAKQNEAGVGLEEIMERLGHSDDEIIRKVYLHVTKTKKKRLPKSSVN